MPAYCTREDVYHIYGKANVQQWADLDNEEDYPAITVRITRTCDDATDYVNSRLTEGPYLIPFTAPFPKMLIYLTAMYAGLMLYDGRQVTQSDAPDQLTRHRKMFDNYLQQIFRGQLKFVDPSTSAWIAKVSYNAPAFVSGTVE